MCFPHWEWEKSTNLVSSTSPYYVERFVKVSRVFPTRHGKINEPSFLYFSILNVKTRLARGFSRVFWGFSRPWPSRIEFPWVFGRRELALGSPPGRAQNAKSHIGGLIGNGLVWRAGRFRILALKNTRFSFWPNFREVFCDPR